MQTKKKKKGDRKAGKKEKEGWREGRPRRIEEERGREEREILISDV